MSLLWPGSLILFLLIPMIVVVYLLILRRRRGFAIRYSSLSLVREAAAHQSWLRRHLPFILVLLALSSLVMALGRPVATVTVPSNRATILLTIDVSRSMCSTDIPPNRMEAAKDAAISFIQDQGAAGAQIGIVAFAGFAELVEPPTNDVGELENAVQGLTTARRTAIGSAILRAIDAISEIDNRVAPSELGVPADSVPPEGEYVPHIIVLLTDGASNAGPFPLTAAQQAADRRIRVYTIGFGTINNTSPMNCGDFQELDQFGGGGGFGFGSPFAGGGGGGFRRELDEATLKQIADMTGGSYYAATSASELNDVFQNLPTYLVTTRETIEISAYFTTIAALLLIAAMILSFLWHPVP